MDVRCPRSPPARRERVPANAWSLAVIRSRDRNMVMKVLESARRVLGPLECHSARGGDPMRF